MVNKSVGVSGYLLFVLGGLMAIAPMSTDMYLPGFPSITKELGLGLGQVELTFSSYFLGMLVGILFHGAFSDSFGRRASLVLGLVIYVLSSLWITMVDSLDHFVVARFLQGAGGSAGVVVVLAIVRDRCDAIEAAKVMSLIALIMGAAPILAPSVGGLILKIGSWRSIFAVLTVFGLFLLLAVVLIVDGPDATWEARRFWTTFKRYGAVFKDGKFLKYTLCQSLVVSSMFSYIAVSPFVLIELHSISEDMFGLVFGFNAFGLIAASQLNRFLLRRYSPRDVLVKAMWLPFAGGVLLLINGVQAESIAYLVFPGFFIIVSSVGLVGPNATALALESQGESAGIASAIFKSAGFGAGMLSSLILAASHDGTAFPVGVLAAIYGAFGFLFTRWVVAPAR